MKISSSLLWCSVAASFLGALVGPRFGSIAWYPLRVITLAALPVLIAAPKPRQGTARIARRFFLSMMAYGFLSLFWSPDPGLGLRSAGLIFQGVMLVLLVTSFAKDRRAFSQIMIIWSLAIICTSVLGYYEVYRGQYLFDVDEDVNIYAIERVTNQLGWLCPRVFSANWNNTAFTNALSALVLMGWALESAGRRRFLATGGALLAGSLVFLSYSRAAVFGLLLGVAVFVLCRLAFVRNVRRTGTEIGLMAGVLGLLLLPAVMGIMSWESVWAALTLKTETADDSIRTYYYSQGVEAAVGSAGFGKGLGASTEVIEGGSYHHFGVEILAELGAWVFLGHCLILAAICSRLLAAIKAGREPFWSSGLLASCMALPLLLFGPSSVIGEGVYWLWIGFLVSFAEQLAVPGRERVLLPGLRELRDARPNHPVGAFRSA